MEYKFGIYVHIVKKFAFVKVVFITSNSYWKFGGGRLDLLPWNATAAVIMQDGDYFRSIIFQFSTSITFDYFQELLRKLMEEVFM